MTTAIALFGAAGKMGARIAAKLCDEKAYRMFYVEAGAAGEGRLREQGLEPCSTESALEQADVMVLAIPDTVIGRVARAIVPKLRPGVMVMVLDPAAPHSGELPERGDITYFVTHPCHPPIVGGEISPEAQADYFGGVAGQHIVCALMQGPEEDYARGVAICRKMFAPVLNVHRVTVEQMAILEPALAETVVLTCMTVMREALDEAISRGVPEQAARDFLFGHMKVNTGILFGLIDAQVSDGAKLAVARAKERIFRPDWRSIFEPDQVRSEVRAITHGIQAARKGGGPG